MTFGKWPEDIHGDMDQQKRIQSAKGTKITPISVDIETQTGVFGGSAKKPYQVSLDECNCADFMRRKLPCKHIYRLAMELGVFEGDYKASPNPGLNISLYESISIIENYSDELQKFLIPLFHASAEKSQDFLDWVEVDRTHKHIVGSSVHIKNFQPMEADCIFSAPFFDIARVGPSDIVPNLKKREVEAVIDRANIHSEKKLLKVELAKWCLENVPNLAEYLPERYYVVCSPRFQKVIHKTITYLRRKHEWSYYYAEGTAGMKQYFFPYGGIFEDEITLKQTISIRVGEKPLTCFFPEDEITELLTLYGHNRCLDGFVAVEK